MFLLSQTLHSENVKMPISTASIQTINYVAEEEKKKIGYLIIWEFVKVLSDFASLRIRVRE
jgi:hypothetical protein